MSRPFFSRSFQPREPQHRCNGKIRAREVRVIDENKQQLGVMSLNDGIQLARSKGMDLIEISATAVPPVCRICEYGKFLYQEAKRSKESRPSHAGKMKEIQLSAVIDPHDFSVKVSRAIDFLCDDMKVHVKLRFRGRQKAHKEFGFKIVNDFVKQAAGYGQADSPPKAQGDRDLSVSISPLPRNKRAKHPRQTAEEPLPTPPTDSALAPVTAEPPGEEPDEP